METRCICTLVFALSIGLFSSPLPYWLGLGTFLGMAGIWRRCLLRKSTVLLLLLSLSCGWARCWLDSEVFRGEALRPARNLEVRGQILEPPRTWGRSKAFLLAVEGATVSKIMVSWRDCDEQLAPGDRWAFSGRFKKGKAPDFPGGFDQRFWLWIQRSEGVLEVGDFSKTHYLGPPNGLSPRQISFGLRSTMLRRLGAIADEDARSLVAGVVFGETQSLKPEHQEYFRRTGTSHLLAASGMNVALLASLVLLAARRLGFGPWRVVPLVVPLVIAYAFLAGCAPSIVRASVGCLLSLAALWIGRHSDPWNSLALSVWALLLWEPRMIYDLGFQLSVLAVVGLLAGPKLAEESHWVAKSLVLTVSASLVTLPLFWFSFQELSSTLLLANLLMGPIVESLFPLGLLLTLVPCRPLAWLCESLAKLSLWLVELCSGLADPIELSAPSPLVILLLMASLILWLRPKFGIRHILALALVVVSVWLSSWLAGRPQIGRGELRIRVIGQVNRKPFYWLSSCESEMLILSGDWQRHRALKTMRKLGCSRRPSVEILEGESPNIRWGAFDWQKVRFTLPERPYLELTTTGSTYYLSTWRPEREPANPPTKHSLGRTH